MMKLNSTATTAIVVAAAAVIGVAALKRMLLGKDDPDYKDTPLPPGTTVDNAKLQALASAIYELFENLKVEFFDRQRCDILQRYNELTDREFVALANFYKNKYDKTIRQSIADTFFGACAFWQKDYQTIVLDRLTNLNVP